MRHEGARLTRPWQLVDTQRTPAGVLELRRRDARDFLICLDGRILMNSREARSEEALGSLTAEALGGTTAPRVLIAGLGMGLTLRAALDTLPADARIVVAELEACVRDWCAGPLRELCGDALSDDRLEVRLCDVRTAIREAAAPGPGFHAIALDLYEGVRPVAGAGRNDPVFGDDALDLVRAALVPGGVFARWTERADPAFEQRLVDRGFRVESRRVGRGGRRHLVYRARLA
jgi:spermidine synthase